MNPQFELLDDVMYDGKKGRVVGFDRIDDRLFVEVGSYNVLGQHSTVFVDEDHLELAPKKLAVKHI